MKFVLSGAQWQWPERFDIHLPLHYQSQWHLILGFQWHNLHRLQSHQRSDCFVPHLDQRQSHFDPVLERLRSYRLQSYSYLVYFVLPEIQSQWHPISETLDLPLFQWQPLAAPEIARLLTIQSQLHSTPGCYFQTYNQ